MRSDRFWMMEGQINRIKSEDDLRFINANAANISQEGATRATEALVLELGEKYEVERPTIVKPQANVGERLKALSKG